MQVKKKAVARVWVSAVFGLSSSELTQTAEGQGSRKMANRLKMAQIQTILILHEQGLSNRKIGEIAGVQRETVGKYVSHANSKPAKAPTGSMPAGQDKIRKFPHHNSRKNDKVTV